MSVRWVRQTLTAILFVAAGALFLLNAFGSTAGGSAQPQAGAVAPSAAEYPVMRAARRLARGAVIRPEDIELAQVSAVPAKGVLARFEDVSDRIASRDIPKGEPLSDANTANAKGPGLANIIPPGMRAVALLVSDETSVANFIRPGDRVDVLVVSNAARGAVPSGRVFPAAEAITILQNVTVLAVGPIGVGGEMNKSPPTMRNVTLAVTPQQAAMVALVRSVGTEYLSLRSTSDDAQIAISPASTNDLQPARAAEQPSSRPIARAAPRPATRVVEVIAGKSSNVSRVPVGQDN
jgi:pilus assembly protein CpaB